MSGEPVVTMNKSEVNALVKQVVTETLSSLGVDTNNPQEFQRDMQHLRDWRVASQTVKKHALLTTLGIFTTGVLAAAWIGLRELIGK